jgi:uncharacterized membrane protein HdeD (DUF308 family)
MPVNAEAGPAQEPKPKKLASPGEEMACLEIAIGILGVLLLIFPAITSFRGASAGFVAAAVALLVGLVLAMAGGFMGLGERRRQQAGRAMKASGLVLTVTAVVLLAASSNGLVSWNFPLGAIFLTLGLFADLAAWRFRKQVAAGHAVA